MKLSSRLLTLSLAFRSLTDALYGNEKESGETMRAAGLHPIETILTSEAVLIQRSSPASSSPLTSQPVSTPSVNNTNHSSLFDREALIALIKSRIAGVIAAGKYVLCNYNIQRGKLPQATAITPGRRAPTVSPLDETDWVAVSAMVERSNVAKTMDELERIGASDILIVNIVSVRGFFFSLSQISGIDISLWRFAVLQSNCRV